ncbi:MAG: ABC-2 transporter permease [Clostridiales bacterium]|nr:ABC-2 transporter permease [Clostridiales bacterium]
MKMYLSLLRKDLLIVKKYILLTFALVIFYCIIFLSSDSVRAGVAPLAMSYLWAIYLLMQTLASSDAKYSKAEAVICATPYLRTAIVAMRYLFSLSIYFVVLIVYILMSLIINGAVLLTFADAMFALLVGNIMLGITQPLTYKFGGEKARYIIVTLILLATIGFQSAFFIISDEIDYSLFANLPSVLIGGISLILTAIIVTISALISVSIYKKKEF